MARLRWRSASGQAVRDFGGLCGSFPNGPLRTHLRALRPVARFGAVEGPRRSVCFELSERTFHRTTRHPARPKRPRSSRGSGSATRPTRSCSLSLRCEGARCAPLQKKIGSAPPRTSAALLSAGAEARHFPGAPFAETEEGMRPLNHPHCSDRRAQGLGTPYWGRYDSGGQSLIELMGMYTASLHPPPATSRPKIVMSPLVQPKEPTFRDVTVE